MNTLIYGMNLISYYLGCSEKISKLREKIKQLEINLLSGICDYPKFVNELEDKLLHVYKNHKF
jgi:hypothetical protein